MTLPRSAAPQPGNGPGPPGGRVADGVRLRRRDFRGWHMVWALSVTETVAYGVLSYSFAVFLAPMRVDLGAGTAALSGALTLAMAVTGVAAVPVGRLLDRYGARWVMSGGSLVGAASVLAWSRAADLPQLYLAFVGIGLAGAAVLYEPAYVVVNTWFRRDRPAALATLTVVAGFASTVFLPTSQALIDALGWRGALVVLAAVLGACAVPQALLLRRAPADLGLVPDGREGAAEAADGAARGARTPPPATAGGARVPPPAAAAGGARVPPPAAAAGGPRVPAPAAAGGDPGRYRGLGAAWRDPVVRRLTVASALEMFAITAVFVHLVTYLLSRGAAPNLAAAAAGALGALSVAGRLLLTGLAARVGMGRLAAAMVGGQSVGVALLLLLPQPLATVAFVVLFGAGFGVVHIARPALLGARVPPDVFGWVSGQQALAAQAGRVVAPVAAGVLIGVLGYGPAFTAVALCTLASALLLLSCDPDRDRGPAGRAGVRRPG